MKKIGFNFYLLKVLLGTLIWFALSGEVYAQRNYVYPFYYPPVLLDTLHFYHPEVGEKALFMIEELSKLQQRTILRYKDEVKFKHKRSEFIFGQWGRDRLSSSELDSLLQIAFEPIIIGDSAVVFLNVQLQVIGPGAFNLFEYNEKFPERLHGQNRGGENDSNEGYVLFGAERDTMYLGEYKGYLSVFESIAPDTLQGNPLGVIAFFPDSHRVKINCLPEETYGIFVQIFPDNLTVLEVGYSYVIVPLSNIDCF